MPIRPFSLDRYFARHEFTAKQWADGVGLAPGWTSSLADGGMRSKGVKTRLDAPCSAPKPAVQASINPKTPRTRLN